MAKILNLDDIKSLPDVPTKTIDIPQWNVSIKVKGISKKMQIELGRLINGEQTDAFDYQKALLKASVIEPQLDDEAIELLYDKDANVIDKLFIQIADMNGVGGDSQQDIAEEFQD